MAGFDVIDLRYRELYDRAVETLGSDPRVVRIDVSGSVASETADRWSDLDLSVIARPEHHASLVSDWPQWLAAITPTVFARTPIAPFIINSVTSDGLTFDVAVWSGAAFEPPTSNAFTVGMLSGVRFDHIGPALDYAVAEQLRGLVGPFISLLQRNEHMRHLTGVPHLLGLLTTVFLAETGNAQPGKHWNAAFTPEQEATVAKLPPVRANREDLIAFGLGVAEIIVRRARPLFPRFGLEWPSALAEVAAARIETELGLGTSDWLY